MAYTATVTSTVTHHGNRRRLHLRVVETECAVGSAWSFAMPFTSGVLRSLKATLVSGAGATIQPRLGRAAAWADFTMGELVRTSAAAAFHHESTEDMLAFCEPDGSPMLHGNSQVNAGTNNVVETELVIDEVA